MFEVVGKSRYGARDFSISWPARSPLRPPSTIQLNNSRDRGKCCVVVSDMQFFMLRSQMDRDYPTATNTYNCPQTFQPSTSLPPPSTPRSDMLLLSLLEDFSSVLVAFAHYTKSVTWVGESMRLSGDLDIKSSSPIRLLSLLYRYG